MTTVTRVGDQAPADRLEYWRSVLCDTFLPLEAVPAGNSARTDRRHASLDDVIAARPT